MKKKLNATIIFVFLYLSLSGCTQQETKYVCSDGSVVPDSSFCKNIELHLGVSYCFVDEVEGGPVSPATPTGIRAGMKLTSQYGTSEQVTVKYSVKDPVTGEVVNSITNNIGSVSDIHEDKTQMDINLDVFLKEENGVQLLNTRLPIDIEVFCSNCQIIGDCQGCTSKGLSLTCR
jgi:hypothetical protein